MNDLTKLDEDSGFYNSSNIQLYVDSIEKILEYTENNAIYSDLDITTDVERGRQLVIHDIQLLLLDFILD